jgi:hypothetical protein
MDKNGQYLIKFNHWWLFKLIAPAKLTNFLCKNRKIFLVRFKFCDGSLKGLLFDINKLILCLWFIIYFVIKFNNKESFLQ